MEYWWGYLIAGLFCGAFSATFGVGSGIILIPTLVLIFTLPQKSAQGICLAAMVPMALVGAIRYRLNPAIEVNLNIVLLLAAGGVAGALIGSWLASVLPALTLRRLFALVMIVAAVRMLLSGPPKKGEQKAAEPASTAESIGEP